MLYANGARVIYSCALHKRALAFIGGRRRLQLGGPLSYPPLPLPLPLPLEVGPLIATRGSGGAL